MIFIFLILSLVTGVVIWSLCHYWIHRLLHGSKIGFLSQAEMLHHSFVGQHRYRFTDFWVTVPPVYLLMSVGFICTQSPHVLGFASGVLMGAFIDNVIHNMGHQNTQDDRWWVMYFRNRHRKHHHNHSGNLSLCTGIIWDKLFGTNL